MGPDAEIKLLQECVERVSVGSSELIFVSGPSGVGKSSLVESLRHGMEESDEYYLVSGKFDQYLRREPFSAISAAFGELVDLFQRHSKADEIVAALRTGPFSWPKKSCFKRNLTKRRGVPNRYC